MVVVVVVVVMVLMMVAGGTTMIVRVRLVKVVKKLVTQGATSESEQASKRVQ